jgi:hypothetical protein
MAIPQTGLMGSEQALQQGLTGSLGVGQQSLAGANSALGAGMAGGLSAIQQGAQGMDIQAALAGLRGNDAQGQAFQNFNQSPGQEFLRNQGERSIVRNASATGGLGGGNVRRALAEYGTGAAAQDFNNQFQRGQQALGSQQNSAGQAAQLAFGTGQGMSNNIGQAGVNAQNQIFNTGTNLAQGRTQAGRDIAAQGDRTTSALAALINQQGSGLSDLTGNAAGNVSNMLSSLANQSGMSQEQLGALLSNIYTGQGSQLAGLNSMYGQNQANALTGAAATHRGSVETFNENGMEFLGGMMGGGGMGGG